MTWQNIILLIAGVINLIMSIIIFSRGVKNKINLYFGLLTLFNFLWAGGLIFINLGINYEVTRFFAALVYPIALMVVVTLLYFIIYFPYQTFKLKAIYSNIIAFIVVVFSIFCIGGYKIFVSDVLLNPKVVIYYEFLSYTIYSVVLVILMVVSIAILISKIKKAEGIFKRQLQLILVAVIIGTSVGAYFHLFLMYLHVLDYNYLGPLFTLFINGVVFYFIFSPKQDRKQLL